MRTYLSVSLLFIYFPIHHVNSLKYIKEDHGRIRGIGKEVCFLKVQIYTTTTCPYCKLEKEYLDSKGIKYENIFVDQDAKAAEDMVKISGQMGVPFTVISKDDGSQTAAILGFDKNKINQALGI